MTDRRGFALVTVLWLVVVLGIVLTTGLGGVEASRLAAENRIAGKRAVWAARGCLAMAQFRHANGDAFLPMDSIALGPTTWCRAESVDPSLRVNPNVGDSVGLSRVLRDPIMVASLLDWVDPDREPREAGAESDWYRDHHQRTPRNGPFLDVREIALVRGFEGVTFAALDGLFTTRGEGRVSPNRASSEVLSSVAVLPVDAPARLVEFRNAGRVYHDATTVVASLGLEPTVDEFQELVRRLEFDEARTAVRFMGRSDLGARVVRADLVVGLAIRPDRLAIHRVEWR